MRKEKFVYNTQTLRYEKVVEPLKTKLLRIFGFLSAVVVAAIIIISVTLAYFPSPKEKAPPIPPSILNLTCANVTVLTINIANNKSDFFITKFLFNDLHR